MVAPFTGGMDGPGMVGRTLHALPTSPKAIVARDAKATPQAFRKSPGSILCVARRDPCEGSRVTGHPVAMALL
jgi:hypothetical protein